MGCGSSAAASQPVESAAKPETFHVSSGVGKTSDLTTELANHPEAYTNPLIFNQHMDALWEKYDRNGNGTMEKTVRISCLYRGQLGIVFHVCSCVFLQELMQLVTDSMERFMQLLVKQLKEEHPKWSSLFFGVSAAAQYIFSHFPGIKNG